LLLHNVRTVYIASRNKANAEEVIAELKAETGRNAEWLELDLSNLRKIKASAEEFMRFFLCLPVSFYRL
jgi:retinol dehydrogenase 12